MEVLIVTIPLTGLLVTFFVALFVWAVDAGQMDELESQKNIIFDKITKSEEK